MTDDPYEVLGVPADADADALTKAYRLLSKKYHPDRNPGDEAAAVRYAAVDAAYQLLSDPERRVAYDRDGTTEAPKPNREQQEVVQLLHGYLFAVVQEAGSGFGPGLSRTDLVAKIRGRLRTDRSRITDLKASAVRGREGLKDAAPRFEVADGAANYPRQMLEAQIKQIESDIAVMDAELERLNRLEDYLDGVRYRRDGVPSRSIPNPALPAAPLGELT